VPVHRQAAIRSNLNSQFEVRGRCFADVCLAAHATANFSDPLLPATIVLDGDFPVWQTWDFRGNFPTHSPALLTVFQRARASKFLKAAAFGRGGAQLADSSGEHQ
jgi:hypothetical protein